MQDIHCSSGRAVRDCKFAARLLEFHNSKSKEREKKEKGEKAQKEGKNKRIFAGEVLHVGGKFRSSSWTTLPIPTLTEDMVYLTDVPKVEKNWCKS